MNFDVSGLLIRQKPRDYIGWRIANSIDPQPGRGFFLARRGSASPVTSGAPPLAKAA
jgi:hypothetical protein